MTRMAQTFDRALRAGKSIGDRLDRMWQWTMSSKPVLPHLERPHLVVAPVLFAGAIGIAATVLPGENERIAAFERDGQVRKALQLLEKRYERGDRSSRTLFDLQRLYDYYGDTGRARTTLEQLAVARPKDSVIQRQLAQLYKAIQDEPAYIQTLKRQIELRYSEPACRELIGIYRRLSSYEAEQALIKQCRALGYRRPDDLIRLAFLEAADNNMTEAAQTLTAVDDRQWLRSPRERQLLFAALVETKRPEEARRRGIRWMRGRLDADLAIDLIYKLVEGERTDLAIEMASAVSQPGDGVALTVAEIMLGLDQTAAARAFLRGWLQQNKSMDLELVTRFVNAAMDCEDAALALDGAQKFGLGTMGQDELATLAETLIASARGREFDLIRRYLTTETIAQNAMLAAGIELRLGRNDVARANLMRVKIDDLDDRRLGHFARLVDQAGRSPALAAVLREPRVAAIAGPVPPVARLTPSAVGPVQKQAKQSILKRAEANRKRQQRQRVDRKGPAPTAAGAPPVPPTFQPFQVAPQ
jgi:tetratricopeptide (TPR) repeat protein